MQYYTDLILILDSTVRLAVPLILACLAGLYSERAGIVDIGLEGKLLGAAFGAAAMAAVSGSPWLGLLAGVLVALGMSAIHGIASINLKGNQTISGVALNFLAAGLTTFLGQSWFHRGGFTPQLGADQRFNPITLPFAPELANVPILGGLYSELISGHNILTYLAFVAVPVTAFVLFRTRFGLRLRAVGENPKALDTAGISVTLLRYQALIITAVLVGIGGTYLSIAQSAGFNNNMSAGRGYIALAALIFAKWRPWPALLVCLLFGFLDALQFRLQGIKFAIIGEVPVQAIQVLPYILTIILLAGFIGRAVAPKASGIPYTKER
ncbi:ABC transporter permease [uncultured Devosia sp.]|uniref:ABC transporter permease n=1 Tax=uncultured Devosia sp. TaxID=211434 RepID=UPI0035CBD04D